MHVDTGHALAKIDRSMFEVDGLDLRDGRWPLASWGELSFLKMS